MNIDSSDIREHFQSLLIYAFVLAVLGLIGLFGPRAVVTVHGPDHAIPSPSPGLLAHTVPFTLTGLSPLNRFLRISFVLLRGDTLHPLTASIQYSYDFTFRLLNGIVEELQSGLTQTASVSLRALQHSTPCLVTLSHVIIDYTAVNHSVSLLNPPPDFAHVRVIANYGSVAHTYFQIGFRGLFVVLGLAVGGFFFASLRLVPTHAWHFEQKLTLPLLILVFFYNNPLYVLQAYAPSPSYIVFDTIARDCFNAYFRFFILALFDSLRFKNRKIPACFYFPKVAIVLALFLSSVAHGIYDDMAHFGLPSVSADNVEQQLRGVEVLLFIVYILWAAGSVVLAGLKVDITERYKFGLYVAAGGTALAVLAFTHVLFDEFSVLAHSSLRFIVGFSVENGFVLLMAVFHWRSGAAAPKTIDKAGQAASAEQDPGLFVDGDEMVD